jgi:PAS domain S-box-containing protein
MLTYKDLLLTGVEAVCVLDAGLEIRQHNQLAGLLLGYRGKELNGRHVSDILYDDVLIRRLLAPDNCADWSQGECMLRTSSDHPLSVKFRAGPMMDNDLPSTSEHYSSENQLPPSPSRLMQIKIETPPVTTESGYVIVFRETDETQSLRYERRIKALRFLLEAVSECDREPGDILLNFVKTIDPYADVMLLPSDFAENKEEKQEPIFLSSQQATEAALRAMWERVTVSHYDENSWLFFPVCSQNQVYGVACIRFAVPRLHNKEDKGIYSLAGIVLGNYMETSTVWNLGASSGYLLQPILSGSDHPIIVVDREGVITLCNAAVQKVYGYTVSEMIGKSFGDLVFPADSPAQYASLLNRIMEDNSIHDEEVVHLRKDWTSISVSFTAYPYKLTNGLIVGAVFIVRDLRERRRLWNKMMQWEKLSALGEVLSSVANELNNPLTSLTGYSQLLLHRKSDEEIDSMVSTIYEEAKRCGDIIRSALDLTRGDELQQKYSHINDIIVASLSLKQRQLKANNIDVCMNLGEGIVGTVSDPHDLERLFLRIINYAEQRMVEYDNGGRLSVESVFEHGSVVVRFSDTGTCILKDDIAEILDPFFTADGEDEGVGLGLSISCQILRNIGGSIRVSNQIGKGNVFTVELPATKGIGFQIAEHSEETVVQASETGKSVLVVDDEPAIVDLVVETLHQMGHTADIAGDGNEAMNKVDGGHYDLIIADLRMPSGFTGDRLHGFIKLRDPELAQRMIFITGDVASHETQRFLQSTGNPYLEKPFLLGSLITTIEKLLSKLR